MLPSESMAPLAPFGVTCEKLASMVAVAAGSSIRRSNVTVGEAKRAPEIVPVLSSMVPDTVVGDRRAKGSEPFTWSTPLPGTIVSANGVGAAPTGAVLIVVMLTTVVTTASNIAASVRRIMPRPSLGRWRRVLDNPPGRPSTTNLAKRARCERDDGAPAVGAPSCHRVINVRRPSRRRGVRRR